MPRVTMIHYEIDDGVHRRAKAAAALEGITLKELLIRALDEEATKIERKHKRGR